MWCCNDVHAVMTYGTSAYYKAAPSPEQRATGVVPLDSLPAAWWNCMWCDTNSAINEARDAIGSFIDEVNTLLTNAEIQPNCNCVDTIYRAINKIRQTVGNAVTAGAVKSSSCPSEVAIDATGIMSVNCLGNASSLTTTARTVVGAVNELKSTYDCCFTDVGTAIGGKAPTSHASSATTYGVGTASDYGHLKISDTYATLVGCACDGIAASQKAVNDLYQLIPQGSSVNWTDPNCAYGCMVVRYGTDLGYVPGICVCDYSISIYKAENEYCYCRWSYQSLLSFKVGCYHWGGVKNNYSGSMYSDCLEYYYNNACICTCPNSTRYAVFEPRIAYATYQQCCQPWNCGCTVILTVNKADFYRHTQAANTGMNRYDGKYIGFYKAICCGSGSAGYSTNVCICNNTDDTLCLTWVCTRVGCCASISQVSTIAPRSRSYVGFAYGCSCCSCMGMEFVVHAQSSDYPVVPWLVEVDASVSALSIGNTLTRLRASTNRYRLATRC